MAEAEQASFRGDVGAESTAGAAAPATGRARRSLYRSYMDLGKARLSGMVVVTTALGYLVGSRQADGINFSTLLWTCLGTFLAALGAGAFNQAIEARRDARMRRTQFRPIPAGDVSATHAAFFGLLASIAGIAILCPGANGLTAMLAFINILIYVVIYTPLKTVSTVNTLVGAVVGGIPPMMGWAAATNSLSAGAWVLGAVLFIWQIPHFLALAWMYREDYARGGYKMLSTVEPTGRLTTLLCVLYSLALIPVCLAMTFLGYAGIAFALISALLGGGLVLLSMRFAKSRSHADARRLFLATILYLPLLSATLVIDSRGKFDSMQRVPAGRSIPTVEPVRDPSLAR